MGQATRTTKLLLDLSKRKEGETNTGKRAALSATVEVLDAARAFHIDFFLVHAENHSGQVSYYSEKHLELRTRAISANELLSLLRKPARWKRKRTSIPGKVGPLLSVSPICPSSTAEV